MRLQLTTIALDYDGKRFNEGDIVVVGEDVPAELAQARLAARTAVMVLDGETPPPEVIASLDAVRQAMETSLQALEAMVVAVETAGPAFYHFAIEAAEEFANAFEPRKDALQPRLEALENSVREQAAAALATSNDNPSEQTGGPAAPPAEASVSAGDPDAAAGDQSQAGSAQAAADQAPAVDAGATLSEGGSDVSTSAEAAGTGETGTATQASSSVSSDEAGAAGAGVEPPPAVGADQPQQKPRKGGK